MNKSGSFYAQTINYRNAKWSEDGFAIEVEIEHPDFGWINFAANISDEEEYGKQLYERIVKEGGEIKNYVAPEKTEI